MKRFATTIFVILALILLLIMQLLIETMASLSHLKNHLMVNIKIHVMSMVVEAEVENIMAVDAIEEVDANGSTVIVVRVQALFIGINHFSVDIMDLHGILRHLNHILMDPVIILIPMVISVFIFDFNLYMKV